MAPSDLLKEGWEWSNGSRPAGVCIIYQLKKKIIYIKKLSRCFFLTLIFSTDHLNCPKNWRLGHYCYFCMACIMMVFIHSCLNSVWDLFKKKIVYVPPLYWWNRIDGQLGSVHHSFVVIGAYLSPIICNSMYLKTLSHILTWYSYYFIKGWNAHICKSIS